MKLSLKKQEPLYIFTHKTENSQWVNNAEKAIQSFKNPIHQVLLMMNLIYYTGFYDKQGNRVNLETEFGNFASVVSCAKILNINVTIPQLLKILVFLVSKSVLVVNVYRNNPRLARFYQHTSRVASIVRGHVTDGEYEKVEQYLNHIGFDISEYESAKFLMSISEIDDYMKYYRLDEGICGYTGLLSDVFDIPDDTPVEIID